MSHPIVIVGCAERLMQVDDEAQKNLSAGASFKGEYLNLVGMCCFCDGFDARPAAR